MWLCVCARGAWSRAEGLQGAVVLYDGQQNDARMTVCVAMTAAQKGASILNHCQVGQRLTQI